LEQVVTGKYVMYRYIHNSIPRSVKIVDDLTLIDEAIKALSEGKKVGIVFRSKRMQREFYNLAALIDLEIISQSFDGDSTKDEMLAFLDINGLAEKTDLITWTTKVTVSADITVTFDRLFISADCNRASTARDLLQSVGRFRELTNTTIVMSLPPECKSVTSYDSCRKGILEQGGNVKLNLIVAETMELTSKNGIFEWTTNHVVDRVAWMMRETRRCFRTTMLATLTWKKWEYIIDEGEVLDIDPDLKGDLKGARKMTKSEINDQKLSTAASVKERFMKVSFEEFASYLAALENSSRDGSMARKMREGDELAIARTLKNMWVCSVELTTPEDIIFKTDNHARLKRHAIMVRNMETKSPAVNVELTQIHNDARRTEFAPMPEVANLTEQSVSLLQTALLSLGVTLRDADDKSKRFSEALVLSNGETIAQLCKQASSADNRGASEVDGTDASDILCLLRRELFHTGLKLMTHRVHSRRRRSEGNPHGEAPSYSLMTDEDVAKVIGKLQFGGVGEIERVARSPDRQQIVLSGNDAAFVPLPPPTDFEALVLAQATLDEVDLMKARDAALVRIVSESEEASGAAAQAAEDALEASRRISAGEERYEERVQIATWRKAHSLAQVPGNARKAERVVKKRKRSPVITASVDVEAPVITVSVDVEAPVITASVDVDVDVAEQNQMKAMLMKRDKLIARIAELNDSVAHVTPFDNPAEDIAFRARESAAISEYNLFVASARDSDYLATKSAMEKALSSMRPIFNEEMKRRIVEISPTWDIWKRVSDLECEKYYLDLACGFELTVEEYPALKRDMRIRRRVI
jgi:hypothetical protein